ncbi:MAG TPA: hypothetical protein VFA20_33940 [Myxococcaceae bacterium]|nr:hypothetical protein [Myxococcaceae bacterium]
MRARAVIATSLLSWACTEVQAIPPIEPTAAYLLEDGGYACSPACPDGYTCIETWRPYCWKRCEADADCPPGRVCVCRQGACSLRSVHPFIGQGSLWNVCVTDLKRLPTRAD